MYVHIHMYIYIYIKRERERERYTCSGSRSKKEREVWARGEREPTGPAKGRHLKGYRHTESPRTKSHVLATFRSRLRH